MLLNKYEELAWRFTDCLQLHISSYYYIYNVYYINRKLNYSQSRTVLIEHNLNIMLSKSIYLR